MVCVNTGIFFPPKQMNGIFSEFSLTQCNKLFFFFIFLRNLFTIIIINHVLTRKKQNKGISSPLTLPFFITRGGLFMV